MSRYWMKPFFSSTNETVVRVSAGCQTLVTERSK